MLNRVILVGRLVKDPTLKELSKDKKVVNFTIAVDNLAKDKEGNATTSFIPCVIWGKAAESTNTYAKKGMLVGIDGRLNQRTYEDKNKNTVYVIEVIADSVQFLESKKAKEEASEERKNLDSLF